VFLEELGESGDGDVERVGAIVLLEALLLGGARDAPGLLERLELRPRLGVDVVGEGPERLGIGVVQEAALLEQERDVRLVSDLRKVSLWKRKRGGAGRDTLSRESLQMSAEPAFAMGMTLISWASSTERAFLAVKAALRLTLQWVQSQTRVWAVTMVPTQTKVHSGAWMCLS
jgi:hypothetical protein